MAGVAAYPTITRTKTRCIVRTTIAFMVFISFSPSTYFPIYLDATTISSHLFEWKCWDTCSCLPPVIVNNKSTTITFHQSYKTSDPQGWKEGWENYRRTWLKLHRESWRFIFWTDSQNDLLASCSGYPHLLSGRLGIQKADLSRLLYLHTYGGLYVDMDYIALRDHQELLHHISSTLSFNVNNSVLLQGREDHVVGLEWGFAFTPQHPFWRFCLDIASQQESSVKESCPIFYTGPKFLELCIRKYYRLPRSQRLHHMVPYQWRDDANQSMMVILEPRLVAPISGRDVTSECGRWRNVTNMPLQNDLWTEQWTKSTCHHQLMQNDTWAVTLYSQSWGDGLKCWLRYRDKKWLQSTCHQYMMHSESFLGKVSQLLMATLSSTIGRDKHTITSVNIWDFMMLSSCSCHFRGVES